MEETRYGWWNGRIYVDEPQISPEQYKMFFGKSQYGISFEMANSILKNRQEGYMEEVVPADELCGEAIEQIKEQVLSGEASGEIEIEGVTLSWNWDPEISMDDGIETTFWDLGGWTQEKILKAMLDNECHSGEIVM